ncbi:MAG: BREX system P-loop protein BrxC [Bryobacterales bacterium]|nr:BREX system P-loop protein BrxC [Bryobacterales bacterium]
MKIHEVLDRDPLSTSLANNGQARITHGRDERVMQELRAELETFVCKGQFADALERILERYLTNFESSRQDAVWVSGFFGSGKSHLLKMLAHLWVNTPFDDGQTARGLVADRLPTTVRDALRELDMRCRRLGCKPVAAAGSLLGGNVGHVRLSVLSIVLRAAGLPEQYAQARFCLWLRGEGLLDDVRGSVEEAGKSWEGELNNLYVSPVIAEAVLTAVPGFAADVIRARQLLVQQFPLLKSDLSTKQFIDTAREVLAPDGGPIPPTVVVLDEVQQYINEAGDRAQIVTELAEALQSQLDSRVLLVASGQSALAGGNAALAWLTDRFRVTVQLADAEVEAVTRDVLLRKKPSAAPAVHGILERHAGEVSRHLQATRLAVRAEDKRLDVGDYPLLRTRRRFWEACFQTTDPSGTRSQLRSQLRILHDSLHGIAKRPVGCVIPASDLFRALAQDLVGSSVLLNEINTRIRKLDDGTEGGRLKADLCGVVFLIGKLPREGGADSGVRADATTLADLLLADIRLDSGRFRNGVARTLEALGDEGVLMKIGDEYRIQTREGAEWERAFREERTRLRRSEVEIASRLDNAVSSAVLRELRGIRLLQGESKVPRTLTPHFGMDKPDAGEQRRCADDSVCVWVRDGWSCTVATVLAEASKRGLEDALLHVYLPKRGAQDLRGHIESAEAARKVLESRGVPASQEGQVAMEGMRSRLESAEAAMDRIVEEIVRAARVFRGGGGEEYGESLGSKVSSGAKSSLARLFPRFGEGDHRRWATAFKRIREGAGTPFDVVGWEGDLTDHPVAKEVLLKVGAGTRGKQVQDALTTVPYGWPQDAIHASLAGLVKDDHLKAERNGLPVRAGHLTQQTIRTAHFLPEKVRLTTPQRLRIRGLFRDLARLSVRRGEEAAKAPDFLKACRELAHSAGGNSPLPPVPETTFLMDLSGLAGNEQLAEILKERERLEQSVEDWKRLGERARNRVQVWELANRLHRHAEGDLTKVAAEVGEQLSAIRNQRSLLDDTNHVRPCVTRLANALRQELSKLHDQLASTVKTATERLANDSTWRKVSARDQAGILRKVGLTSPRELRVGTNENLRAELNVRGLAAWRSQIDAVPVRESRALAEAAKRGPGPDGRVKLVRLRRGTLDDEKAVRKWLAEHERQLMAAVRTGPVILE